MARFSGGLSLGSGVVTGVTNDTNVTGSISGNTLTLGWTGQLGLTRGGTAASLTASNGGIVYSTASALALLSGTATAGLALISGASTTPSWFAPTAGSVLFAGTGGILQQNNANLFWDDANNRLGIGINSPTAKLQLGNISGSPSDNAAIILGTLTGGTSTNYQMDIGTVTAVASATNRGILFRGITGTAASSTNEGISIGTINSTGTTNTGLKIADVSGATNNYALITGAGNVGIGTAGPGAALDVQTNVSGASAIKTQFGGSITNTANSQTVYGININPTFANGGFTGHTAYTVNIAPAVSGAGTLNTAYGFYVSLPTNMANNIVEGAHIVAVNSGANAGRGLVIEEPSGTATHKSALTIGSVVATSGTWSIYNNSSNQVYLGTGNVGIGTASPSSLGTNITTLDIVGGSGDNTRSGGLRLRSSNGALDYGQYFASSVMQLGTITNQDMFFTTNNTERMRITTGGNVGIGTAASPDVRLRIEQSIASDVVLKALNTVSQTGDVNIASFRNSATFNAIGDVGLYIGTDKTASPAVTWLNGGGVVATDLAFRTGGTERMRILSSNGNVGIGVTAPSAVLHLKAGTATASTAPLKFNSGTNLTTAETGAVEYDGTNLFFTRTGTTRESVICSNAVNSVNPTSPNRTITVIIAGTTYYLAAKTTND